MVNGPSPLQKKHFQRHSGAGAGGVCLPGNLSRRCLQDELVLVIGAGRDGDVDAPVGIRALIGLEQDGTGCVPVAERVNVASHVYVLFKLGQYWRALREGQPKHSRHPKPSRASSRR